MISFFEMGFVVVRTKVGTLLRNPGSLLAFIGILYVGVSENREPQYSTLNCRILIIRTTKQGTPNFRKLPCGSSYLRVIGPGFLYQAQSQRVRSTCIVECGSSTLGINITTW